MSKSTEQLGKIIANLQGDKQESHAEVERVSRDCDRIRALLEKSKVECAERERILAKSDQ